MREDIDIQSLRQKLANSTGKAFWRSLNEAAGDPAFEKLLQNEFPKGASVWKDGVSRRNFVKLMGASLALGGLTACSRQPDELIVPYVEQPEEIVPGKPLFFATAMPHHGYGLGVLAESHTGRPTKIEGNPLHPASLGATDVFAQASVLTLYDPDRTTAIRQQNSLGSWETFIEAMQENMVSFGLKEGQGLRILTEPVTSPTMIRQMEDFLEAYPEAQWHQYSAVHSDASFEGTRRVFGRPLSPVYHFNRASVVVALDSDFLHSGPGHVRYARDFAEARHVKGTDDSMCRLYAVESTPTLTGAMADHRLPERASVVENIARALAAELGVTGAGAPAELTEKQQKWVSAAASDLRANPGAAVVSPGEFQPAAVHAIAQRINAHLNSVGVTVEFIEPVEARVEGHAESLRALAQDIEAGEVEMLLILGGNPAYQAPADIPFEELLPEVPLRIYLGLYPDETAALCQWHLNAAHYLESWGDVRAYDGSVSFIQPLIEPLYKGKSDIEVMDVLLGRNRKGYDIVRAYWREQRPTDFERFWQRSLSDGLVADTAAQPASVQPAADWDVPTQQTTSDIELLFRPDPSIDDGQFANNGWLQELPKPLTKITWDNALLMSAALAEALEVENEDLVEVTVQERTLSLPVWITPGHAEGCATVHLGYGRPAAGRVGTGVGFDAYAIRTSDRPWQTDGAAMRKTGDKYLLARTEDHHMLEQGPRPLVRSASLDYFKEHPDFAEHMAHTPSEEMTMYDRPGWEGHAWAMTIDLNRCTGCNSCVIACQAENNIPIVGKEEVGRGREMHWIRVDRYYSGGIDEPETFHQPVPCMHCEQAPCEVVCPVAATVHSEEGLNDMVYNRCVGTRYCSNNCPYKVRRFNFLHYSKRQYAGGEVDSLEALRNPDVTVRSRGVMEKCTYCVQRINTARIEAKKEGRPIRDGEVVTACQQACPSQAILFGDLSDPDSAVSITKRNPRNYALLGDVNTRPRTTYLAKLNNWNSELKEEQDHGHH
jgi:molybdopterin-containing oxidoreductase family iron-sulfur binding subunit